MLAHFSKAFKKSKWRVCLCVQMCVPAHFQMGCDGDTDRKEKEEGAGKMGSQRRRAGRIDR